MRGLKSTLVLFLVLVGLGAYIYFVDSKKPVGEGEKRDKVFTGVTSEDIEELEIKAEDGAKSRLKKADGKWTIVDPVAADTDAGEISSITSSLSDTEVQRVVDENPKDLKAFGLDPPRLEVGLRTKGQTEFKRLQIGNKTPTGSDLYARTPDKNRVFLVSSFLDSTFNKNTFALREKNVLKFERDKAETVELTSGGSTLQVAKSGTEWKIVKPIAARGDFGAIEGIVERLSSAQMQGITSQDDSNLKMYGLDKPSATIVVGTGSARATLLLGTTENAVVYAKDGSRPMIFTVAPTIKDDVFKKVDDLRRKDLFDSRSFTASHVELKRGAETFTFDKTKGKDEKEVWKTSAGKEADSTKMDELLSRLTALRATSFEAAANASLKAPVLTATIRFDENKTETVTFGRAGSDVYASRADEPGSAKLEGSALDEVTKAIDAVK
jgi:uncharacterized protein DUF4340